MDIIDAHIYNPAMSLFKTKKSDPAEFWLYMCANKEACDLSTRTVKPGPSGRGYKVQTATAVMGLVLRF